MLRRFLMEEGMYLAPSQPIDLALASEEGNIVS